MGIKERIESLIQRKLSLEEIRDELCFGNSSNPGLGHTKISHWPNNGDFYILCMRGDTLYKQGNCFHVNPSGCKNAMMAMCVFEKDGVISIRRHRIGNCPDTKYKRED